MPPAARTVCASRRCRLPTTSTWLPASVAAIAARSPAAPAPMTRTLQTRLRADGSGIFLGHRTRRHPEVGTWSGYRVVQGRKVLGEGGEVLTGKAEDAGWGQRADGRRAAAVVERPDLPEVIARPQLADHLLIAVDLLGYLHLTAGDDVEAATQLPLAHDRLAGTKSHRHHGVGAAQGERRQVVWQHRAPHPMQGQPETATPGGHERKKQRPGYERGHPAVKRDAPNLGDPVAPSQQRDLAEARRMTGRRWLAADVGEDVVRRLPAFAERHHDHRPEGLAARRVGNRRVIAGRVHAGPSGDPAERIAGDASPLQLDRHLTHERVGPDANGGDDAPGLDPRSVGEDDRAGRGFLDTDAKPQIDSAVPHAIEHTLREAIVEGRQHAGEDVDRDHP